MTSCVYYNSGGIRVTTDELVVRGQRYRLDELDHLVVARGSHSRTTTTCATVACLLLALASCSWEVHGTPVVLSTMVTVFAVGTVVAALVSRAARPCPHELWATYRHHTVQLLWSRDERVFNQIRYAVCRARQAGPSRTHR